MKVFEYNPRTGTRSAKPFANWRRATWTASRWNGYDGLYHAPTGFGPDADVTVHHNAGIGLGDSEESYRHSTKWIAFCLGGFHVGLNDDGTPREQWTWVVLPPRNVRDD